MYKECQLHTHTSFYCPFYKQFHNHSTAYSTTLTLTLTACGQIATLMLCDFHSTYHTGSVCESYSLDEESLGLQLKVHFYVTYSAGSVGESDSLVHENHSQIATLMLVILLDN